MSTKVHTLDSLKSTQKSKKKTDEYIDKPKVNVKTIQDFSEENDTESEYIVKKEEINDLCERSNMIIKQYRSDIVEARGDYRLLKKYDKLEKFVEKQSDELKTYYSQKVYLEKEIDLMKEQNNRKTGGIRMEVTEINSSINDIEKEIEEYCNKNRKQDDFSKMLHDKYGLKTN